MICAEFSLMNWRQLLERLSAGSMNTKQQKWAEVSTWATKAAASAWRESLHWGVLHAARVGKSCHELHGGARGLQKKSRKWGIQNPCILTLRRNWKLAYQKHLLFTYRTAMGKTIQWEQKPLKGSRKETILLQHILTSLHTSMYLHRFLFQSRSCRDSSASTEEYEQFSPKLCAHHVRWTLLILSRNGHC